MNANFGLVDDLPNPIRDKKRKREMIAERALNAMSEWKRALGASDATELETGVQVAAGN
jgi:hypothetical protein